MPYTTRADGDVLTASSHNANCRDQVVSTVTSGTRPAGTEGQLIGETDTDRFQVYSGSGWMQFGGWGAWTSWTPQVNQSANATLTVTYARYFRLGRLIIVGMLVTVTGGSMVANNPINVSVPVTAAQAGDMCVGAGRVFFSDTGQVFPGTAVMTNTTTVRFFDTTQPTTVYLGQTGSALTSALTADDVLDLSIMYEAAS